MIEDLPQPSFDEDNRARDEPESQEAMPEISFHVIAGANHHITIRTLGKLKNENVTILIDGSSTDNFIDQALVTKHGLSVI